MNIESTRILNKYISGKPVSEDEYCYVYENVINNLVVDLPEMREISRKKLIQRYKNKLENCMRGDVDFYQSAIRNLESNNLFKKIKRELETMTKIVVIRAYFDNLKRE
jgi:hypothetical protein